MSVALFMLVLFAPLMITIALWLMIVSGGPVFYGHVRVGRNGKLFRCLKFRTMVVDADIVLERLLATCPNLRHEWETRRKLQNDPRIISGVGHFLRSTSLDELPQIFNVLRGEMSIAGPRPVVTDELSNYGPFTDVYLSVKPGLTGPWQAGARSESTYGERVREDVRYVQTGSLWSDMRLVVITAARVCSGCSKGV